MYSTQSYIHVQVFISGIHKNIHVIIECEWSEPDTIEIELSRVKML